MAGKAWADRGNGGVSPVTTLPSARADPLGGYQRGNDQARRAMESPKPVQGVHARQVWEGSGSDGSALG
jgi:hypothetical protein